MEDLDAVPTSRKVNGKALSTDISLTAEDVGARPASWTPTVEDLDAVPTSRNRTRRRMMLRSLTGFSAASPS